MTHHDWMKFVHESQKWALLDSDILYDSLEDMPHLEGRQKTIDRIDVIIKTLLRIYHNPIIWIEFTNNLAVVHAYLNEINEPYSKRWLWDIPYENSI